MVGVILHDIFPTWLILLLLLVILVLTTYLSADDRAYSIIYRTGKKVGTIHVSNILSLFNFGEKKKRILFKW